MMRESARKSRELKEASITIERLSRTDALTGLASRRTLDETLARETAREERLQGELGVIIADLDHFKSTNDQYGHLTGDKVLAGVAAALESHSRPYDLAARYGGEEFVLVLPGTSTDGAIAIAERIREDVAVLKVPGLRDTGIGKHWRRQLAGEAAEEFMARADAALYSAKSSGRNRVKAAPGLRI